MTTPWYQNPGQDGMFWKLPFQVGANWIRTGPLIDILRNGGFGVPTGYVHLPGDYSVPFVIGQATDPLVTIVDATGGLPSFTLHIPLGTVQELPITGTDNGMGVVDVTKPYALYTFETCTISAPGSVQASGTVITCHNGIAIDDATGQLMMDIITNQPGTGNAFGTIQDFELTLLRTVPGYVIPHMLAYELDPSQVNSSAGAWPLLEVDNSFPDTGGLQQGLTIGIPADVAMPTGQTPGFEAWWNVFQQQGGFFYNVSSNNSLSLGVYQSDPANAALAADMQASLSAVMAYMCILNPTAGVAGAQYSLATQKGMVGGVRNDAFPAPPVLDLSPTGGVTVLPSTFGAWYPSQGAPFNSATNTGYDVQPPAPVLPPTTTTTWDPAYKAPQIILSNGNLTATSVTTAGQLARSTTTKSSGLIYLEFTLNAVTTDIAVGICNKTESENPQGGNGIGGDAWSAGFYAVSPAQATYTAGNFLNGGTIPSVNGEIVSVAINFNTTPPTMYTTSAAMRAQGATWNNSATANPATGVGGQPLTGIAVGPYYACFNDDDGGAVCTVNFGATAFSRPIPVGYSAWDVMAGSSGSAAGLATVAGKGHSFAAAVGRASGVGTVKGISPGSALSVGTAAGLAIVAGASSFTVESISPPFDFTPTIISQYANSPTLNQLISNFAGCIDPTVNLDAFYNLVWNVDTAVGYGLDVWGRIVGVGRVFNVASGIYFGFAEAADDTESPFNSGGPLFSGEATTGSYALTDEAFRLLIFAKALSNITDGSIPSINQILLTLFPGRGNCWVGDNLNMSQTFHFNFALSQVELSIVDQSGILPKSVGVSLSIQQAG